MISEIFYTFLIIKYYSIIFFANKKPTIIMKILTLFFVLHVVKVILTEHYLNNCFNKLIIILSINLNILILDNT